MRLKTKHWYDEGGNSACPFLPPLFLAMMTEHLSGLSHRRSGIAEGVKPPWSVLPVIEISAEHAPAFFTDCQHANYPGRQAHPEEYLYNLLRYEQRYFRIRFIKKILSIR
jgi:hypothetical protein